MSIEETPTPPAPENAGTAAEPFAAVPTAPAEGTPAPSDVSQHPAPASEALPLPAEAQAIDDDIRAALIMVAHGNARLSRLAGNIRFAYLQRDESKLINERRRLKTAFQSGASNETELKAGLQTLLQRIERQAGSLLAPPARSQSEAEAAVPLDADRSNQIRRALREAMMSLAAAAPLHLQIELAPEFTEAEPDVMAMAARVHALHRLVLGSLKGIRWHSPLKCTLSFDDGKENKTLEVAFGDQGIIDLPPAYRQNQSQNAQSRPGTRSSGQSPGGRKPGHRGPRNDSGMTTGSSDRPRRNQRSDETSDDQSADQSVRQTGMQNKGRRPPRTRQGQGGEAGRSGQDGERKPGGTGQQSGGRPSQRNADPARTAANGPAGQRLERGRPHGGKRQRPGQNTRAHAEGNDQRSNRPQKSFPSNSTMADKLRAALGGSKLGGNKNGK
ncbi:MAG: hypothetical protein Q4A16_04755 [Lautropia sp.]|nr:hypothetical protein [Lautropia sp.]